MQIEKITTEEKAERLRQVDENSFDGIILEVARATFENGSSTRIEVYAAADGELKWFPIEQNSIQPLADGECYIASIRAGADVMIELENVIERDDEYNAYIPADEFHERIEGREFVGFLFGDHCDSSHIIEATKNALLRSVEGTRIDVAMSHE